MNVQRIARLQLQFQGSFCRTLVLLVRHQNLASQLTLRPSPRFRARIRQLTRREGLCHMGAGEVRAWSYGEHQLQRRQQAVCDGDDLCEPREMREP